MKEKSTALPVTVIVIVAILVLLVHFQACESGREVPDGPVPSLTLSSQASEGEKAEKPELSIWLDLNPGVDGPGAYRDMNMFLRTVPGFGKEFTADVECAPGVGVDRDSAVTHFRIEMMSGKGPDLLICTSISPFKASISGVDGTFNYPQAMMRRNMFHPLSGYIAEAQYMEWDKLQPEIMAAGEYGGEQYLLPLSYTIQATVFDKELYTPSAELPMTWQEMAESSDPGIVYACTMGGLTDALGQLGDYENEEPAFSEEELLSTLETIRLLREERMESFWEELGDAICSPNVPIGPLNSQSFSAWTADGYLVPAYNRSGGATANVNAYAAINANAQYPDIAFRVLDKLMSKEAQQECSLYDFISGLPTYIGLGLEEAPLRGVNGKAFPDGTTQYGSEEDGWYLSEWNYSQLQDLLSQVKAVDFYNPLHRELDEAQSSYMSAATPEEREKIAHDCYTTLRMMLAES